MSTTRDYFDSIADIYTTRSHAGLGKWLRKHELAHVKDFLGSRPLGHVLELGSGSGYYSHILNNLGCESLTCVDFSSQMLKNLSIPGCTKVEADVQEFRGERIYDTIFCCGAIEFLNRPQAIFDNAARMLAPMGSMVVLVPWNQFFGKLYKCFHALHQVEIKLFTRDDLNRWAAHAGLELVEARNIPMFSIIAKLKLSEDDP
jgi:2-polyprenyl-3-methyl-5-hydroxy-6-metoxy-1,4-benzoquinol methylase